MNPPPFPDENNNNSIAHQAAKASLVVPVLAILAAIARSGLAQQSHNPTQVAVIFDLCAGVLIMLGFVASIIALAGIPTYGSRGLLGRGIAGLVMNGFFYIHLWNEFHGRVTKGRRVARGGEGFPGYER